MIADLLSKEVTIAGRRVLFTHRVLLRVERETGVPAMQTRIRDADAKTLRAFAVAIFDAENVDRILGTIQKLKVFKTALVEAWGASMPAPEELADHGLEKSGDGQESPQWSTLDFWSDARFNLGLTDEQWLDYTPKMIAALERRRLAALREPELMLAKIAAAVINYSHGAPKDPAQPNDLMLHPYPKKEEQLDFATRRVKR